MSNTRPELGALPMVNIVQPKASNRGLRRNCLLSTSYPAEQDFEQYFVLLLARARITTIRHFEAPSVVPNRSGSYAAPLVWRSHTYELKPCLRRWQGEHCYIMKKAGDTHFFWRPSVVNWSLPESSHIAFYVADFFSLVWKVNFPDQWAISKNPHHYLFCL